MRQKIIRLVTTNDRGLRIGEDHHNSKLTNHEVDLIRDLYEVDGVGISVLAVKFGVSKGTIHDIVNYRRRAQTIAGFRKVRVPD